MRGRPIGAAAFAARRNFYVSAFLHALKPVRELYFRGRAHGPAELTSCCARLRCRLVTGNKRQHLPILHGSDRRARGLAGRCQSIRHVVVGPAHRQMCDGHDCGTHSDSGRERFNNGDRLRPRCEGQQHHRHGNQQIKDSGTSPTVSLHCKLQSSARHHAHAIRERRFRSSLGSLDSYSQDILSRKFQDASSPDVLAGVGALLALAFSCLPLPFRFAASCAETLSANATPTGQRGNRRGDERF
jgi:hypothetical protein